MRNDNRAIGRILGFLLAAGVALGLAGAAAAEVAGTVTAVTGEAESDGNVLAQNVDVAEDSDLTTGKDAGASVLLKEDAVVELCGNTEVQLKKKKNQRTVKLDSGSIRLVAEPRLGDDRIEVQTNLAIAQILGTIVSVDTDELTNETVITCETEDSLVQITITDDSIGGERVIQLRGGERLRLTPGQMPKIEKLTPRQKAGMEGCLDYRVLALAADRNDHETDKTDDYPELDIPDVGADGPDFDPPIDDPIDDQTDGCTTTTCSNDPPMMEPDPCPESACGADPGGGLGL